MLSRILIAILLCTGSIYAQASEQSVVISYNSDWPPYSFGSGASVKGVLPDLMEELIHKRLGIDVVHEGQPWRRAQNLVKQGQADAMITFASDDRLTYSTSSENIVYSLQQRPVVRKEGLTAKALMDDQAVSALNDQRVCMMIGDGWTEAFYKQHQINADKVRNTQACLRMIASDRADVFIHPAAAVNANMRETDTSDVLVHLPIVYAEMQFSLLLSKQSGYKDDFIEKFDALVNEMKASGEYDLLIEKVDNKEY